jgi:predicted MFS family arabinose efflux permease
VTTSASSDTSSINTESPRHLLVVNICLTPTVGLLGAVALSPFLPVIASDLGTTVPLLGQIPATTMVVAAVFGLVVGPLADRYGYKRFILFGLLAAVVSGLGIAIAPTTLFLLIAAVVSAGSRAILQPVSLALAGTLFSGDTRRRAISLVTAVLSGALIVGLPIFTTLGALGGWRLAFVAIAALAAALVISTWHLLPPDRVNANRPLRTRDILLAYRPLLRHPPTLCLVATFVTSSIGAWGSWTYLGAFLIERQHLTVAETGIAYSLFGFGVLVGSLAVSGRLGKLPLRMLAMGGSSFAGVLFASVFLLPVGPIVVVLMLPLATTLTGITLVARQTLLVTESPAGRATTMTLSASATSLGSALGSSIGGLLLALADYSALGFCALGAGLVTTLLIWLSRPRKVVATGLSREPAS